ncbi:MAG: hypothetical protein AB9891_11485 [Anaerolineaceae bacterium]
MSLKSNFLLISITTFIIITLGFIVHVFYPSIIIPVSGAVNQSRLSLEDFNRILGDGDAQTIRGVYVQDIMALRVVQQPANEPEFVSTIQGTVTHFGMASSNGITGLLAHNFAAGELFFDLAQGHVVNVSYGDGTNKSYQVSRILRFQALQPDSPTSNFINLETNENLTASDLFSRVFSGGHHLTLQTCIRQGTEDSWGRLFIIAEPI